MIEQETPEEPSGEADASQKTPAHVPTVRSEELLQGARELRIRHGGEVYRLQLTRNNKLILQK
jgi:hemin uptake protein HemP